MNVDWQNASNERLMLWIMHEFANRFAHHAILKGGMQLMLMSSERATNDLDYVFVPYESKKEIAPQIEELLEEIPDADVEKTMHSNSGRYRIRVGKADVQVEFNVLPDTESIELTTELLAKRLNVLPRIVRVMSPNVALAHRLAAWNERRLLRDLYDAYYLFTHIGAKPDREILEQRLARVQSRLPALSKIRKMSMEDFIGHFREAIAETTDRSLRAELAPLLGSEQLAGLLPVLKSKLNELASILSD